MDSGIVELFYSWFKDNVDWITNVSPRYGENNRTIDVTVQAPFVLGDYTAHVYVSSVHFQTHVSSHYCQSLLYTCMVIYKLTCSVFVSLYQRYV